MITSLQNPAIKNIVKLSKNRERREQQLFVIEGARELSLALQSGYRPEALYVCGEIFEKTKYPDLLSFLPGRLFLISHFRSSKRLPIGRIPTG